MSKVLRPNASKVTRDDRVPVAQSEGGATNPLSLELMRYYNVMSGALGPMRWWPARTPFEVIVGAILTQSAAWGNVERAIGNLRSARMLTPSAILGVRISRLAALVRPSGYFRQKAKKLKSFARFLQKEYGGSLKRMFQTPTLELREKLLSVHGIGPETADSILLYAGNHPVFVVDAYTHRIFGRHAVTGGKPDYERVRAQFETALPRNPHLFNEFHALIVNTGKNWCRKSAPRCDECPLRELLPADSSHSRFLLAPPLLDKIRTSVIPSEARNPSSVEIEERGIPRFARNDGAINFSTNRKNSAASTQTEVLG